MLRHLKWLLIAIPALLFLTPLLVLIINLDIFDEAVHPELQALLDERPPPPADEQNGYIYLSALDAPAGASPLEIGRSYIQGLNEIAAAHPLNGKAAYQAIETLEERLFSPKRLEYKGLAEGERLKPCSMGKDAACLSKHLDHTPALARELEQNAELIGRYRRLLEFTHFQETLQSSVHTPIFGAQLSKPRHAYLAGIIIQAEKGDFDTALRDIEHDMNFWLRVLAETHALINKLIATAYVHEDLLLLVDLDQAFEIPADALDDLTALHVPLSREQASLHTAMANEIVFQTALVDAMQSESAFADQGLGEDSRWARLLMQDNATKNRMYRNMKPVLQRTLLDAKSYAGAEHALTPGFKYRPHLIYNPIGKILADIAQPDFDAYIERVHDLEAARRMVALYFAAGSKTDIDTLRTRPEFLNPYTGAPMHWDAKRARLTAGCRQDAYRCSIQLSRAAP